MSFCHSRKLFSRSTMLTALRGSKGGNPGETPTGPPTLRQTAQGRGEQSRTTIDTFGGDGPRISSFRLSTSRFCLFLFLCLFVPGQTSTAAEVPNLTVVSYPARPAKLPLWLAQDAGLF